MSDPFIGEIRMFGGIFAPMDWAFCNGQILQISQNDALFALIGNTYGGDGQTTFALPDLRGRVPMHRSNEHPIAQMAGVEKVTPAANQVAAHTHAVRANKAVGGQGDPTNAIWAAPTTARYSANSPSLAMKSSTVQNAGGSQSHENMMPFLAVNFIIALAGLFPTQG
jgi:microcystin-dependent protein